MKRWKGYWIVGSIVSLLGVCAVRLVAPGLTDPDLRLLASLGGYGLALMGLALLPLAVTPKNEGP